MAKKFLSVFLTVVIMASIPLFSASDESSTWWLGRPMVKFSYEGLQNVPVSNVDDLTFPYLGKAFTNDTFNELQANLYASDYFSYFEAEALPTGESDKDLEILFRFTELPQVSQIVFVGQAGLKERELSRAISLKVGDFATKQQFDLATNALISHYREKGYDQASVSSEYQIDEATNKVVVTFTIDEGVQSKVVEILFEGNDNIPSTTLKRQISSKVQSLFNTGNFSEQTAKNDSTAIEQFYQKNGYIDAKVTDVRFEDVSTAEDSTKRIRIVYVVSEGEPWTLGSISVEGNAIFSDETIQSQFSMKSGDVLDIQQVNSEISKVADLYWNEGYIYNNINISESQNTELHTVDFLVTITEQGQAVVEDILINGLTKTKPYVFERELTIKVGDVFSKAKMIQSGQNIYNTGLVTDVQFNILYGSEDGKVVLEFTVVEGNQMDIQFGATFGGNVDGFPVSGFVQWSDKNLGGTGRDLAIATNISPDTQSLQFSFNDDWVGSRRWSNGLTLTFERSIKSDTLQRGVGSGYYDGRDSGHETWPLGYNSYLEYAAADKQTPLSQYLMSYEYYRIALGYSTGYTFMFDAGRLSISVGSSLGLNRAFYDENIYDPYEQLIQRYHERWQFSNRMSLYFTWDGRDLIENTTKGYLLSQQFSYAGGVLFGLSNYIKTSTSASGYLTLFTIPGEKPYNGVLSLSSSVSFMLPQYSNLGGYEDWGWYPAKSGATKYEMLYIDGMNIGRGFTPVFDQSFLWDNMLEFSIPVVQNVLAAEAFVSATGVTSELEDVFGSFSNINWYFAAGAGIKLKIPGFPLGLYLVKNAAFNVDDYTKPGEFSWVKGDIFKGDSATSGMKLVLAITTSLF
ncbi:MAG: outer membrane protein assembly factor BamA [Sphaerochaetaceae bacterium]|jgi:outer membrane protein insertion porin family